MARIADEVIERLKEEASLARLVELAGVELSRQGERTISSTPVSRRWRFLTICGANVDSVSRGTSISTGRSPVSTVF